jgi:ABC-type protease/lipase transport system fused ATPase/permease subunit
MKLASIILTTGARKVVTAAQGRATMSFKKKKQQVQTAIRNGDTKTALAELDELERQFREEVRSNKKKHTLLDEIARMVTSKKSACEEKLEDVKYLLRSNGYLF